MEAILMNTLEIQTLITRETLLTVCNDGPLVGHTEMYQVEVGDIVPDDMALSEAGFIQGLIEGNGISSETYLTRLGYVTTTVALQGLLLGDESLEGGK
jgi:hypothetical protein